MIKCIMYFEKLSCQFDGLGISLEFFLSIINKVLGRIIPQNVTIIILIHLFCRSNCSQGNRVLLWGRKKKSRGKKEVDWYYGWFETKYYELVSNFEGKTVLQMNSVNQLRLENESKMNERDEIKLRFF